MKNTSRKNNNSNNSKGKGSRQTPAQENLNAEQARQAEQERRAKAAAKNEAANKQKSKQSKQDPPQKKEAAAENEVLYKVQTLRDSAVLKAFITFTYRVYHPRVTGRMLFYGILILLPGFFLKIQGVKIACWVIGALVILLALFRQYISLAITKNNDPDYKNKTLFTYEFTRTDASFYTGTQLTTYLKNYKDIIAFYYDDDFYYMALRTKEFFVLPKARFITGDPKEFEDFIYKKSKKACVWIPDKFSDKLKKRRIARAMEIDKKN